jgi:hypothetical protein
VPSGNRATVLHQKRIANCSRELRFPSRDRRRERAISMQEMSMSARTRTIEKSNAERSRRVVLRRAQTSTTRDLFLNINRLVRWRHDALPVACCGNHVQTLRWPRGRAAAFYLAVPISHVPIWNSSRNSVCATGHHVLRDCSPIAQKCAHHEEHSRGMKCRLTYRSGGDIEPRLET